MNNEMARNNVPMTQAHYEAATQSIRRGDHLCQYLTSENQHVLDSTGSGFVYHAGRLFHCGLNSASQGPSDTGLQG